jgi:hypothetical protein
MTPASQSRFRRPWREWRICQPGACSEQAAILPRIQVGDEQWRMGLGRRSSVTLLVTRPPIERLWPGRCVECRSAQGSKPEPLRRPPEDPQSRVYGQRFRNWFRVKASGSIGPMYLKSGAAACAHPSSAMSPAGYSLALLSSNRLRFAGLLNGGSVLG